MKGRMCVYTDRIRTLGRTLYFDDIDVCYYCIVYKRKTFWILFIIIEELSLSRCVIK